MVIYNEPNCFSCLAYPAIAPGKYYSFREMHQLINQWFQLHRQRVRFLTEERYQSGISTPIEGTFTASGSTTPVDGRTVPITLKESHFH